MLPSKTIKGEVDAVKEAGPRTSIVPPPEALLSTLIFTPAILPFRKSTALVATFVSITSFPMCETDPVTSFFFIVP